VFTNFLNRKAPNRQCPRCPVPRGAFVATPHRRVLEKNLALTSHLTCFLLYECVTCKYRQWFDEPVRGQIKDGRWRPTGEPIGGRYYITRAKHWLFNDGIHIRASEWSQLTRNDPDLLGLAGNYLAQSSYSGTYEVEYYSETDGPTGTMLIWRAGNLEIRSLTINAVAKMFDICGQLDASVQDENGKVYRTTADWER
jgi:hypothetical protein